MFLSGGSTGEEAASKFTQAVGRTWLSSASCWLLAGSCPQALDLLGKKAIWASPCG